MDAGFVNCRPLKGVDILPEGHFSCCPGDRGGVAKALLGAVLAQRWLPLTEG